MTQLLDSAHLTELARDKSHKGRAALAAVINDLFDHNVHVLSDRERRLMFNIIENLIHEVEVSVRRKFSEKLARSTDAPRSLIKALANDDIDVAYPVLVHSNVLRDQDLIEIIHLRTEEYHLAVTLREDLEENVSAALVETDGEDVIVSLLNNKNAKISEATLEYLVEQSRRVDTFQEPLLHRQELKKDLAKKMFIWVSEALRTHIISRYKIDENTVDALLKETTAEALEDLPGEQDESVETLLRNLKKDDLIDPDILVKTLSQGEIPLFVAIFCEMTGLDNLLVRRILFGETGEGVALACRAVDIPELQFATIFSKTRRISPTRPNATRDEVNNMLAQYRGINVDDARQALDKWRGGSDYMQPIRMVLPDV